MYLYSNLRTLPHVFIKRLNLRRKHSSLRRGDYLPLYCDENVMIYSRGDQNERLIVAINKSGKKQNIKIEFPLWMKVSNFKNILGKNSKIETNKFQLPVYSGSIWKCELKK